MENNINKYDKFLEELQTKKFKDLKDWKVRPDKNYMKKTISDTSKGTKFIELFEKYGILVEYSNSHHTLHKLYKFKDELKLEDVRIGLYSYMGYDKWEDYNGYTKQYTDDLKSKEEYEEEYKEYKKDLSGLEEVASFSTFPGSDISLESCMTDAYNYYTKKLKDVDVLSLIENDYGDIELIKQYSKNIELSITNDNLEIIDPVGRRLRLDSKVFYYLEEEHFDIGEYSYRDFINDLNNL